jgi:hypothetical protein
VSGPTYLFLSYVLTQIDGNRQIVLGQNGVSYLMSLAYRRVEPDFVVPALYNICVDHDRATKQLVHWEGESLDVGAGHRLEDGFRETSPSKGALEVLLSLADALWHEERKPLLADLLELASQSGSLLNLQEWAYDVCTNLNSRARA